MTQIQTKTDTQNKNLGNPEPNHKVGNDAFDLRNDENSRLYYSGVPNKRAARLLILKEIFLPTWPY